MCTVVREDAKNTETEETRLFCHIFITGGISIGGGDLGPLATPMCETDVFGESMMSVLRIAECRQYHFKYQINP